VANEDVSDGQRYRAHFDIAGLNGSNGFCSGHPMGFRRDFYRPVGAGDRNQSKADHQDVRGQSEIGRFGEERPAVIDVSFLILRSEHRNIATPLIGDYTVVHRAVDHAQDGGVEEKLRAEDWRLEGHGEEMAAGATIRVIVMRGEVLE
jgi:hypothetical protein